MKARKAHKSYLQKVLTKEALVESYDELKTLKAVGRKFGVDAETIKRYMLLFDLNPASKVRYNCNHSFFSVDTQESFYTAGFLSADGAILDGESSRIISIGLSDHDRPFLELLVKTMGAENPIHDYDVKTSKQNPKWKNTRKSEVKITSDMMAEDLLRFGVTPRKSLTLELPEWMIEHPLRHHFLRGSVDGDGSFYSSVSKNKTVKQVFFSLRGTVPFLTTVRSIFEKDLGLDPRTKPIRISSGCGVLEYGGNTIVKKIAEYLYRDQTICLERKRIAAFAFEGYDTNPVLEDLVTKEDLEKRYSECRSATIVGKELGICSGSVIKLLKKYSIPIFDAPQTKSANFHAAHSAEDLLALYDGCDHNMAEMARRLGIGHTTMMRYLKQHGII